MAVSPLLLNIHGHYLYKLLYVVYKNIKLFKKPTPHLFIQV